MQSISIQLGTKLQYPKSEPNDSPSDLQSSLEPLQKELAIGQVAEFHYTNAPVEVNPPPGEFTATHAFS